MGKFGTLLFLFGTVLVSSKASSNWQYNIPTIYRDNGFPPKIMQEPYDQPAKATEEKIQLFVIPEAPKLGELCLSETRLPATPYAPILQEVYAPKLSEFPTLPVLSSLSLPELNIVAEELKKLEPEKPIMQLTDIPEGPYLQDVSFSPAAVKIEETAATVSLPLPQPPASPSFTYDVPAKLEISAPATIPCGIFELSSYSPAQGFVQNPWEWSSNYASNPARESSAPLEEIRINSIPQFSELPPLSLPEFNLEQPAYIPEKMEAPQPEPEPAPTMLAAIPEAPALPPFEFSGIPATIAIEQPALPSFPTPIIIEQSSALPTPYEGEISFNTISESKSWVQIPDAPQLPYFTMPQNLKIESARPEPLPKSPILSELPALPEITAHIKFPEPILVQEIELRPVPEGPALPEFSPPAFSDEVEIKKSDKIFESAPAPAPLTPLIYAPAIDIPAPPTAKATEEKIELLVIPEAPKLGELSLSETRLPATPYAPILQEVYAPKLSEFPTLPVLPSLSLPEFNIVAEELKKLEPEEPIIQLTDIPEGPYLEEVSFSPEAVKIEETAAIVSLPLPQPPASPSFTYDAPTKLEISAPATIPCGIFELPSYSPAQGFVQNPWEWSSNYASNPARESSAPLEEIRIISIPKSSELPPLSLPEFNLEQPDYIPEKMEAPQPEPEPAPTMLAAIPEAPALPSFEFSGIPATIAIEQPALPSFPTPIIIEQSSALPTPYEGEIRFNTISESKSWVQIPDAPQLPYFTMPQNIKIETARPEPLTESPILSELPSLPEITAHIKVPEPILVQEIELRPVPEGPALPEFSPPAFSDEVEIKKSDKIFESAPAPAPLTPLIYAPAIDIPAPPTLGEINLGEIRLPEVRLPQTPVQSSTQCACEEKASPAPVYVPEYPKWSSESNDLFFRMPEIDYRIKPIIREPEQVTVTIAPEYAPSWSPKLCVENIVKERVLPNIISGPKELLPIPDGPQLPTFNFNSLPVV